MREGIVEDVCVFIVYHYLLGVRDLIYTSICSKNSDSINAILSSGDGWSHIHKSAKIGEIFRG